MKENYSLFLEKQKQVEMSQLKVYRASAGSGKTYTLTKEYIRLLFSNPGNYRQTLAVTFTNKATSEMRSRILLTLHNLADDRCSAPEYMEDIKSEFSLSEADVRIKSAELLRTLLHDYSRFSISTIDSFFQKVTRSFAREMGLPVGFRLELETSGIMIQAIDRLLLELDEPQNEELKLWLVNYAEERMRDDKSWNITREIFNISHEIFKEKFQANSQRLAETLNNRSFLNTYRKALLEIVQNIENQFKEIGNSGLLLMHQHNLDINSDFKGKSRSKAKIFEKLSKFDVFPSASAFAELLESPDKWYGNDCPQEKKTAIESACNKGLIALLSKATELIQQKARDYHSATLILRDFNALGILNDVNQKMMQICREQNIFPISGTNYLLARIIDNNETPFIYEKTGTRFVNYMMDEFQDTSALQYNNFVPLVNDSLAAGGYALMVGDVKQAIYRWRNSDWNLLAEQVEEDFATFGIEAYTLDTNWRSSQEVIQFNNSFFQLAGNAMQNQFNQSIPDDIAEDPEMLKMTQKITNAYSDVSQIVPKKGLESGGNILLQFIEAEKKEEFQEMSLQKAIPEIMRLIGKGYSLSDICVLVRNNRDTVLFANALLSGLYHPSGESLPVISNEALVIANSEAIKLIIAQLRYLQDPQNKITESFIRSHLVRKIASTDHSLLDASNAFNHENADTEWHIYKSELFKSQRKPLYELTEEIVNLLPVELKNQHSAYIESFMSLVLNYINQESADLNRFLEYWDKKGHKTSLTVPDKQEAVQVMTIHKSKGLEFRAVVIPFADWEMNSFNHQDLVWLEPKTEPFNALPLVPVSGLKIMSDSHFAKDYYDEILHQYVDNLNVTYVAFTRARESLSIFGHQKSKKNSSLDTITNLLKNFVDNAYIKELYSEAWDEETLKFKVEKEDRTLLTKIDKPKKVEPVRPEIVNNAAPFLMSPRKKRMSNHLESDGFFSENARRAGISHGKTMHQLFENIIKISDLERALKEMCFLGKITEEDVPQIKNEMEQRFANPLIKSWFDGTYDVKTEAGILYGNIKRPDRVMVSKDEVVVVDYKFGTGKHPEHIRQVKEYMALIKKMGYEQVRGYLWYMEKDEVERVLA
jgi:ATP-dependent helicase/nuclease subunit A